ncbi:MAG: prohibitin family protein [Oscillospiraceae bacterium]|nr:prohibitin family protein [Oscillospiraceae bacterium]
MAEIKFSTGNNGNMSIDGKKAGKTALIVIIIVIALIVLFNCFTTVDEGFIGVKYQFGKIVKDDLQAGLQFKIPFIEEVKHVDIREQIYLFEGDAFTKDTQPVTDLHLKATYRFQQDRLSYLIQDVGIDNIKDRYFVPNVQRIAKDIIGRYDADMLVQSRFEIQQKIEEELFAWLIERGVILTSFSIENINFQARFLEAVENKVVAEQDVVQMRHRTEEKRVEAEQIEISAKAQAFRITTEAAAEAEAIALIQEQLTASPQYIEYLKIQNWNGILPQVIGDGVNPFVVLGAGNAANTNTNQNTYTPPVNQD